MIQSVCSSGDRMANDDVGELANAMASTSLADAKLARVKDTKKRLSQNAARVADMKKHADCVAEQLAGHQQLMLRCQTSIAEVDEGIVTLQKQLRNRVLQEAKLQETNEELEAEMSSANDERKVELLQLLSANQNRIRQLRTDLAAQGAEIKHQIAADQKLRDKLEQQRDKLQEQLDKLEGDLAQPQIATIQQVNDILRNVEDASLTDREEAYAKRGWTFAHPVKSPPEFLATEEMQTRAQLAIELLKTSLGGLSSGEERQPVVFATMGCSGIGKSRMCDEGLNIFFPRGGAFLLKVAYNLLGVTDMDIENPVEAFRWRVIASARVSTVARIPRLLEEVQRAKLKLTHTAMMEYLQATIPEDLHILLVVDELMKLDRGAREKVVSECAAFVSLRGDKLCCCLITSFLPSPFDQISVSGRKPLWMPQTLLSPRKSLRFVQAMLGPDAKVPDAVRWEMVIKAGGHPRCLCEAVKGYRRSGTVPSINGMLFNVFANTCSDVEVIHVLRLSYVPMTFDSVRNDPELQRLWSCGILLVAQDDSSVEEKGDLHRIAIPAPAMAMNGTLAGAPPALRTVQFILKQQYHQPSKDLERVALLSDFLRYQLGLGVVPPQLRVTLPFQKARTTRQEEQTVSVTDWSSVRFRFDAQCNVESFLVLQDVLSKDWICMVDFQELDQRKAYVCPSCSHPGFESMYFAEDSAENPILVLHQEKINGDLSGAILGLNKAATSLRAGGWKGDILFLVVCMEANIPSNAARCPLLLVTATNAHWYFTPSLSPVALALLMRHYQDVGVLRKSPKLGTTPHKSASQRRSGTDAVACGVCGTRSSKKCGGCESVVYCSRTCQKADWQSHRADCKRMKQAMLAGDSKGTESQG